MVSVKWCLKIRNGLEYYPDRLIGDGEIDLLGVGAVDFFVKTKDVLVRINGKQVSEIRRLMDG